MSKKAKTVEAEVLARPIIDVPEAQAMIVHEESAGERMLAVIEKASTDTRCNVEKMRALLDMKMELVRDERRILYSQSMRAAQEEMKPVVRKAWNEHTKSNFAKLEHIDHAIRPIYTKHGFSLSFNSKKEPDGSITAIVDVMHDGGHTEQKELNMNIDTTGAKGTANKTNPQGVSSSVSILKRQLTGMVFNITFINEDDDGQGGMKPKPEVDRFANKATPARAEEPKQEAPKMTLEEAAEALSSAIKAARTLERRGQILMNNVKLIGRLDAEGYGETAAAIRKLAEETPDAKQ